MVKIKCYSLKKDKKNDLSLVKENMVKYEGEQSLTSPQMVYEFLKETLHLHEYAEESLYAVGLSGTGYVKCIFKISQGSQNCSVSNIGGLFKRLLLANCSAFFVAHNHPSNNINPSQSDVQTTENIKKIGKMLEVPMLDHIIVGENDYYSFCENS